MRTPRRQWPRITVPPELFDMLIVMARSEGYDERTLYLFLYSLVTEADPTITEKRRDLVRKLADALNTRWLERPDDDGGSGVQ